VRPASAIHLPGLAAAGFAATAIGYGPARMGFGLFVPELRAAFGLSSATVGYVSSLGFLGFFLGLIAAQAMLPRRGPAAPVLFGLAAAAAGMAAVAAAPSVPVLALGVFLATASAGFTWTPFNDAVHRRVPAPRRPAALSTVSTGTGVGIASAGLAALAVTLGGGSWRLAWAGFAAAALVSLAINHAALRGIERDPGRGPAEWRALVDRAAIPLFVIAFAYGATSAIYLAFAADRMTEAGGVPGLPVAATPAALFVCYGLVGLAGLATGRVRDGIGLAPLLRLLMLAGAASAALVALAPGGWAGLTLSAGLQGLHVMMTSAVLAFWSDRLFPTLPSLSFTAALLATAAGSVLGPAVAGTALDAFGPRATFLGAAALPGAVALLLRARHTQDGRDAPESGQADAA
jgi:predicted MFS family arabinose efflux permease